MLMMKSYFASGRYVILDSGFCYLWQHGQKYPSTTTESTLSIHRNQNQELHTYHWQNSSSSWASITSQSCCQVFPSQVEHLGGDWLYLLPTQQQTSLQKMHSKQCATNSQIDGASEDRRYILGMSIWYAIWTWNCWGRLPKRQEICKSCGHSMPFPSEEFSKTYQHRVGG